MIGYWTTNGASVKVTHEPTGETVRLDNCFHRSDHKKKEMALKIIRSRLWAIQNGMGRSEEEVSVCDIPEDRDWYPNDFVDYREEMK